MPGADAAGEVTQEALLSDSLDRSRTDTPHTGDGIVGVFAEPHEHGCKCCASSTKTTPAMKGDSLIATDRCLGDSAYINGLAEGGRGEVCHWKMVPDEATLADCVQRIFSTLLET
jgi:hypothetical protein